MAKSNNEKTMRYDTALMCSSYADICNMSYTREEVALFFGVNRVRQAGQKERDAKLTNKIILNPFVAKRLYNILKKVLLDYNSKYGFLEAESQLPTDIGRYTTSKRNLPHTKREGEKTNALLDLIKNIDIEYSFERSFKVFEKTLLSRRFLLVINKSAIKQKTNVRIMDICEQLDMPVDFLEYFKDNLSDADFIYFGFEKNEKSSIYKAYLEFLDKYENNFMNHPNKYEPFLLNLGFKWDVSNNTKQTLTRYTWIPHVSVEDIMIRVSKILDPSQYRNQFEIIKSLVAIASKRIPHHDIRYLEVVEDNNPRMSFDINLYKANLQIEDVYPILLKICQLYFILPEEFQILYDRNKTKKFGHLSGGIDREGRDFLTIYFGVEKVHSHNVKSSLLADDALLLAKPI